MILYVLITLIIIGLLIEYYKRFEYFSNSKKKELNNNMKKTLKSMNSMISGLSYKNATKQ